MFTIFIVRMSGGGICTSNFGPPGWSHLHCVAHGFPTNPKEFDQENLLSIGTTANRYRNFFTLVGDTLPCKFCRESYREFIANEPMDTTSRETLTFWLWKIHNKVNDKLGVSYKNPSFEEVTARYENYRASCHSMDSMGCISPMNHKKTRLAVIEIPRCFKIGGCLFNVSFILFVIIIVLSTLIIRNRPTN